MQALELAQKHYFFELERKDRLNRECLISIALAGTYFSVFSLNLSEFGVGTPWATIGTFVTCFSLVFGAIFAAEFRRFFGHEYWRIEPLDRTVEILFSSIDYDMEQAPWPKREPGKFESRFWREITNSYARCAALNRETNHEKSAILLSCNQKIIIALAISAMCYPMLHH